MEALLIMLVFLGLMVLGIPIGTSLGVAAVTTIMYFNLGIGMLGRNFVSGIASFPLLAIPFFVLAGTILQKAGLAAKIAHFFELLVGRATGGLAVVAVMTAMFWGAISGSGPATTAAVGLILIAPMVRHGYDKHFAAATIATSADLSIIIPPSIAFIIYGNITSVSVSALFVAGIVPGILMGIATEITAYFVSRKRGYRGLERTRQRQGDFDCLKRIGVGDSGANHNPGRNLCRDVYADRSGSCGSVLQPFCRECDLSLHQPRRFYRNSG